MVAYDSNHFQIVFFQDYDFNYYILSALKTDRELLLLLKKNQRINYRFIWMCSWGKKGSWRECLAVGGSSSDYLNKDKLLEAFGACSEAAWLKKTAYWW